MLRRGNDQQAVTSPQPFTEISADVPGKELIVVPVQLNEMFFRFGVIQ
jgi:hypothetical protein